MTEQLFDDKKVISFFSDFNNYEQEFNSLRIESSKNSFQNLFTEFSPIDKRLTKILKEEAPYYNLFSILNIKHYETYVHTPFLRHLLDPNESHEQGGLFLISFFKIVLKKTIAPDDVYRVSVEEEYIFNDGRIDLLISYTVNGVPSVILIENKIYHHDEPTQLQRYFWHVYKEKAIAKGNYHIVYLKPFCSEPTSHSIRRSLYKALKNKGYITELGYHLHIAPWLESLLPNITATRVRETVTQYIETIKTL